MSNMTCPGQAACPSVPPRTKTAICGSRTLAWQIKLRVSIPRPERCRISRCRMLERREFIQPCLRPTVRFGSRSKAQTKWQNGILNHKKLLNTRINIFPEKKELKMADQSTLSGSIRAERYGQAASP